MSCIHNGGKTQPNKSHSLNMTKESILDVTHMRTTVNSDDGPTRQTSATPPCLRPNRKSEYLASDNYA
eukprot:118842-Pleurochrysis_carterae.AAC.1